MDIETTLKTTLNLSDYEILIYTKLLEKEATPGQILRKIHISRASLYRVIDELHEKGLLIKHTTGKRLFYEAVHPDHLLHLFKQERVTFEEKQHQLERAVYELLSYARKKPTDASITIEKGIDAHYRYMKLQLTCKEKLVRMKISNESSIYSYTRYPESGQYEAFLSKFLSEFYQQGIYARILITVDASSSLKSYNITNFEEHREVHILPEEILPNISFKVFDEYSIFTLRDNDPEQMTIITIRNRTTADFLKAFFDFVFNRSIATRPYKPLETVLTKENVSLPKLGIGTAGVGGYWDHTNPYFNEVSDLDQIRHALSRGMFYVDTCFMYGDGRSTELVSRAIKNIPRQSLFITAKLTKNNAKPITSAKEIVAQCDRYLKVLGTDMLDQFQIHGKTTLGIPKQEAVQTISELIKLGKVRFWGVGNYAQEQLEEVQNVIKEPLFANELPYGVYNRTYEENGTLEYMARRSILHIAYFTLRHGGSLVDEFDYSHPLVSIAHKHNKTPAQIALNWVVSRPQTIAIVKSTNGTHINENIGSLGWNLTREETDVIQNLSLG